MVKINCPEHGVEFEALDGCPRCSADRQAEEANINSPENIAERVKEAGAKAQPLHNPLGTFEDINVDTNIVKVKYFSDEKGPLSNLEYSYFSEVPLALYDKVMVPVRGRDQLAIVTAINVPESEIEAFKDKVKIIPAGSAIDAKLVSAIERAPHIVEDTEQFLNGVDPKVNLCDTCTLRKDYPVCCAPDIEFGTGEGNDNIIHCSKYVNGPAAPCSVPIGVVIQPEQPVEQETLSDEEEARIMAEGEPETGIALFDYDSDVAIQSLVEQAKRFRDYADGRVVNSPTSEKSASADLVLIRNTKRAIAAKRKEYLDPVNAKAAEIRTYFKQLEDPIEEADKLTSGQMLSYSAEVTRQRVEAERLEAETLQLAKDQELFSGEHTVPLEEIPKPAEAKKRVRSEVGVTSYVDHWQFRVINIDEVPREWMIPDEAMLSARATKHHDKLPVSGIEFFNKPYIAGRSK